MTTPPATLFNPSGIFTKTGTRVIPSKFDSNYQSSGLISRPLFWGAGQLSFFAAVFVSGVDSRNSF